MNTVTITYTAFKNLNNFYNAKKAALFLERQRLYVKSEQKTKIKKEVVYIQTHNLLSTNVCIVGTTVDCRRNRIFCLSSNVFSMLNKPL